MGLPGSGKGIFVKAAERLGLPTYVMGDIIREEARRRLGSDDSYHTGILMRRLREEEGMDIVARLLYKRILLDKLDNDVVLIDGLRNIEELEFFRERFDKVVLIAVVADVETRFRRLISRGRVDDVKSFEEFIERENRELSIGLSKLMTMADYYFINVGIGIDVGVDRAVDLLNIVMKDVFGVDEVGEEE